MWFRAGKPPWDKWEDIDGELEEQCTLADALAVATFLNAFIRHCSTVRMANMAQVVNVLAPIMTSPEGLVRQTIFHPALPLLAPHAWGGARHARRVRNTRAAR